MVFQEFISPLHAELIIDHLNVTVTDTDQEGNPVPMRRKSDFAQEMIFEKLQPLIPQIENHYNIEYKGTEVMVFEWHDEGCLQGAPICENSHYTKGKWMRTRNRDISGILFLSEHREQPPFDEEFEVFGGKLQFPNHQFSFNPQRGTLILYPSGPHFINVTSTVHAGSLFQVRINIAAEGMFMYDPKNFPGDYTVWLQEYA